MIRATNDWLKLANDNTKVVVGHGPLAKKSDIAEYNAMVKTRASASRDWSTKARAEPRWVAAKPLADLDETWADNEQAAANFVKQVYNSFNRSSHLRLGCSLATDARNSMTSQIRCRQGLSG